MILRPVTSSALSSPVRNIIAQGAGPEDVVTPPDPPSLTVGDYAWTDAFGTPWADASGNIWTGV